jgi:hypothetical protein
MTLSALFSTIAGLVTPLVAVSPLHPDQLSGLSKTTELAFFYFPNLSTPAHTLTSIPVFGDTSRDRQSVKRLIAFNS